MMSNDNMIREILFRGKRVDNGEWVEGDFCKPCNIVLKKSGMMRLLDQDGVPVVADYAVIPKTVGQFTGMTDKNGNKIFERDIVKVYEDIDYRIGEHKSNRKTRTIISVVVFDKKRFEYQIKNEEYNLTLFRLSKKETNGTTSWKGQRVCLSCYDKLYHEDIEKRAKTVNSSCDFKEWELKDMAELFWVCLGRYVKHPTSKDWTMIMRAWNWAAHADHACFVNFNNALEWCGLNRRIETAKWIVRDTK